MKTLGYLVFLLMFGGVTYLAGQASVLNARVAVAENKVAVETKYEYVPYRSVFLAKDTFDAVNRWRTSKGLNVFTEDQNTCDIAEIRAYESAKNFSHDGFKRFTDPKSPYSLLYYAPYRGFGENLSSEYSKPDDIVLAWENSPKHRELMESKKYTTGCLRCVDFYCSLIMAY